MATQTNQAGRSQSAVRRLAPFTAFLGVALLTVAWVFSNPIGMAPDEPSHYVKTIALGNLDLLGRGAPPDYPIPYGLKGWQRARVLKETRMFRIAPKSWPLFPACAERGPTALSRACPPSVSGTTLRASEHGSYQPFVYVIPALLTRLVTNAPASFFAARLGFALSFLALLWCGLRRVSVTSRSPMSIGLITMSLTPSIIFFGSSLGASGTEIAAGWAMGMVGLFELPGERDSTRTIFLLATASVLALGRSTGPLYCLIIFVVLRAYNGRDEFYRLVRLRATRGTRIVTSLFVLACASCLVWEFARKYPVRPSLRRLAPAVKSGIWRLWGLSRDGVGNFGWLNVQARGAAAVVWIVPAIFGFLVAFVVGRKRDRWTLLAYGTFLPFFTVAMAVFVIRPTGFIMQVRFVLPIVTVLPVLAAAVLVRNTPRESWLRNRWLLAPVIVASLVQFESFYENAWRWGAYRIGPAWFLPRAQWQPPLGWALWLVVGAFGAILLAAGLLAVVQPVHASGDLQLERTAPTTMDEGRSVERQPLPVPVCRRSDPT